CGGLSRFNTTAARFSIVSATVDNRPMLETMGAGVVLDDDRIAVGARTQDGVATINLIDRHTGQTRQRILEQGYLSAVHQADDGSIWIGHHGLRQFNRDLQELRAYVHDPMDTLSLSSNVVLTVLEDAADYLWVGTALGLDRLDRATGSVRRYVPGGLLSAPLADERGVTARFAASDGGIWVGTRVALHRFDADTETFRTFSH